MMAPPLLVMMGVSGSGKSVVGTLVAQNLGVEFLEGDDLHSPEAIAKMTAGIKLTDTDRAPWLERVGKWLKHHDGAGGVATCSALRRRYRDRLRELAPRVRFVHLEVEEDVLAARLDERTGHFMPKSLLPSQLATLQGLAVDEPGATLRTANETPEGLAEDIAEWAR